MILYVREDGSPILPTIYLGTVAPTDSRIIARRRVIKTDSGRPYVIDALAQQSAGQQELDDLIDAAFALGRIYERGLKKRRKNR